MMFHERRALAYREQTNVPKQMVRTYEGIIPDYEASLKLALDKMKSGLLEEDSDWAKRSLENAERLEADYFK